MSSILAKVRGFFTSLKNKLSGKKHTRRHKKVAPVAVPAPVAPVAPVPTPQVAGRKMRAANLRKMKFYKPRRGTRRGSRR